MMPWVTLGGYLLMVFEVARCPLVCVAGSEYRTCSSLSGYASSGATLHGINYAFLTMTFSAVLYTRLFISMRLPMVLQPLITLVGCLLVVFIPTSPTTADGSGKDPEKDAWHQAGAFITLLLAPVVGYCVGACSDDWQAQGMAKLSATAAWGTVICGACFIYANGSLHWDATAVACELMAGGSSAFFFCVCTMGLHRQRLIEGDEEVMFLAFAILYASVFLGPIVVSYRITEAYQSIGSQCDFEASTSDDYLWWLAAAIMVCIAFAWPMETPYQAVANGSGEP